MSESIIEVAGISKKYTISHQHKAQYGSLRDSISTFFERPFLRKNQSVAADMNEEEFWALKNVSFTINKGEIFGVIGKNGSGKSTLLKILSRIVEPTEGQVHMRGRVASLLEVGTGFHPELTGRENVFFNGSMLGMSKDEIGKKFDEIVAFAEIERFLDTPVKFYSSGMYVRLAFAVAAHLEPDILILDEVLAVGDVSFQKKSFNKIQSTMQAGCTVLLVSHSAENIRTLCKRGVLLADGQVKAIGSAEKILLAYGEPSPKSLRSDAKELKGLQVNYSRVLDPDNLSTNAPFKAEVEFEAKAELPNCFINFCVEDSEGVFVLHSRTDFTGKNPDFAPGKHRVVIELPRLSLNAGAYSTWFRFYAKKDNQEYIVDTDRQVFEVTGRSSKNSSAVDIPAAWSWKDLDTRE